MDGEKRRKEILTTLKESKTPVPGTKLAGLFSVSRQVIVQDIAVLRAAGYNIISTYRGYLCQDGKNTQRIFCVSHTDNEIEEELNTIVDFGGTAEDVFIHHNVYGTLRAELSIHSRKQVQDFIKEIRSGQSSPLKNITYGRHYHTISAENEEILDAIEEELKKKNFMAEESCDVV
nr:transcription repressor NadR [uncultured Sellimonas sp.]